MDFLDRKKHGDQILAGVPGHKNHINKQANETISIWLPTTSKVRKRSNTAESRKNGIYPFCMTSLANDGVSSGLNATRRFPRSSKQYNYKMQTSFSLPEINKQKQGTIKWKHTRKKKKKRKDRGHKRQSVEILHVTSTIQFPRTQDSYNKWQLLISTQSGSRRALINVVTW